ncbi:hypothetical protein BD779DRAFT_227374 [Infundibulicybe gibba]|nr:hypothetical protein BD779DRAFT_227374 [Infundibulicybe gibba]
MGLWKRFLSLFKSPHSTWLTDMPLFPSEPTDILKWQTVLAETVEGGRMMLEEVEGTHVVKLELWKRRESPYHEFILAYLVNPAHDLLKDPVCIVVDRTRRNTESNSRSFVGSVGKTIASQSTVEDSRTFAVSSLESLRSKALDQFHCITAPSTENPENHVARHGMCQLLKTATFDHESQPKLTTLIGTAQTLTESEEYYKLLQTQCYWFAGSLFIYMARSTPCWRRRGCSRATSSGWRSSTQGRWMSPYWSHRLQRRWSRSGNR